MTFPTFNHNHQILINNYSTNNNIIINHEFISAYDNLKYEILSSDPGARTSNALFKFLSLPTYLKSSYTIEGYKPISINIPTEFSNPQPFTLKLYPLDKYKTQFASDRPYNYLATFDESTIRDLTADGIEGRIIEAIKTIMYFDQAQSRFAKIWRQMAAAILTVDLFLGTTDHIFRHFINALFIGKNGFKVSEVSGFRNATKLLFTDDHIPSTLPMLIYGTMQAITGFTTGSLNYYESIVCLQQYLNFTVGAYYDNVLASKDGFTDWVYEATVNLKEVLTIYWNKLYRPEYAYMKQICRTPLRNKQIEESQLNRKSLPPIIKEMINNAIHKSKNLNDIYKYQSALRYCLDNGMYLDSALELVADKAIMPNVQVRAVPAAVTTLETDSSMKEDIYTYSLEFHDSHLRLICNYNKRYIDLVVDELNKTDLDALWRDLLTTSSAGVKIPEELKKFLTKGQASAGGARLIIQAFNVKHYRDKEFLYKEITATTGMGIRIAILRRVRGINMSPNEQLLLTIPPYAAGNASFLGHSDSATGSQKGNYYDFRNLLYWTSQKNVLMSSIDVKGMDANMQDSIKDIFASFVFDTLSQATQQHFGPFMTRNMILKTINNEKVIRRISAAHESFALLHSIMRSATYYKSNIFERAMVNREGAFSSGIQYTSTNHIFVLSSNMRVVETQRIESGKPAVMTYKQYLGDDVVLALEGKPDACDDHMEDIIKSIGLLGFKITLDISDISAVFLQQQVAAGTYRGLPDRISLFTREKMRSQKNLSGTATELMALGYDLLHRVRNHNGLKLLLFNIIQYCIGYTTYELTASSRDTFTDLLTRAGIQFKLYPISERKTFMCTIYAPVMWTFIRGGGNMPSFATEREDGSYTLDQYLTSPTGLYLRRYLFDISNIENSFNLGKPYLNHEYLGSLGFASAEVFSYLDQYDIKQKSKRALIDPKLVQELGFNLEELITTNQYRDSRQAFYELKDLLGKELPHDIVFGLKQFERIYDTLVQGTERKELNVKYVTEILIEQANTKIAKIFTSSGIVLPLKKEDAAHCFLVNETDQLLTTSQESKALYFAELTSMMPQFSPLWYIMQYVTWGTLVGSELSQSLSAVKGKYKNFAYDSNEFKAALEMRNRSQREQELFYRVLQASDRYKFLLKQAVEYYVSHNSPNYVTTINPRQLMFLPDSASSYSVFLDNRQQFHSSMQKAYALTSIQSHILAHPHYVGKFAYSFKSLTSYA